MQNTSYRRTGPLKDISSYPDWLRQVVQETATAKALVVEHELFTLLRDAQLPLPSLRAFLAGAWPTIEQFPQFMSMNLKKLQVGSGSGEDLARAYLIHNIRVEQKHAAHWLEWARAAGLTLDDIHAGANLEPLQALAHWCWYVCDREPLAVAVAATNYAVEGATGEWSCRICAKDAYALSLPEDLRRGAMRWLRVHAEYDDTHPWEALEIVATLLGTHPPEAQVARVRKAILTTYAYYRMGLDAALLRADASAGAVRMDATVAPSDTCPA